MRGFLEVCHVIVIYPLNYNSKADSCNPYPNTVQDKFSTSVNIEWGDRRTDIITNLIHK